MHHPLTRIALAVAAASLLAALPAASAATSPVAVESEVLLAGEIEQSGVGSLLRTSSRSDYTGAPSSTAAFDLQFNGSTVRVEEFIREGYELAAGDASQPIQDPARDPSQPNRTHERSEARAQLQMTRPGLEVRALSAPGFELVSATFEDGTVEPMDSPCMSQRGIQEELGESGDSAGFGFTKTCVAGPHSVTTADDDGFAVHLRGDFVLEIYGAELLLQDESGYETDLRSGHYTQPASPGTGAIQDQAHAYEDRFLRIHIESGHLRLGRADAGDLLSQWATGASVITSQEDVVLEGATGSLWFKGKERSADDGRLSLPGPVRLDLAPQPGALEVRVADDSRPAGASGGDLADAGGFWAGIGLTAVAVAGGGTGLALRRTPSMARIENALEAGRYTKAARLSGRILARQPGRDEAALSRAVALSKSGRSKQVIQEVTDRLARHEPEDGTMHYVLGLAYLDVGDSRHAEQALKEAAQRTPALTGEVSAHLDRPQTPGSQAYA